MVKYLIKIGFLRNAYNNVKVFKNLEFIFTFLTFEETQIDL